MADLLDYADELDRMAGDALRAGDQVTAQRRLRQSQTLREVNPLFCGQAEFEQALDKQNQSE